MKINREARRDARKLLTAASGPNGVEADKAREIARRLVADKPRHYIALLQRFKELIAIEEENRTYAVETAVDLPDKGAAIFARLEKRFGPPLATRYEVKPDLLGGVVVYVGSRIWDGSIRHRVRTITPPTWIRRRGVDVA